MPTVISVQPWSIWPEEIAGIISETFPDVKCTTKGEYFCFAEQSKRIGATIHVLYDTITVKGGFTKFADQAIFTALVIALGVIPPLVVYYFAFHRKMKAFEKDLAECITNGVTRKGILPVPGTAENEK